MSISDEHDLSERLDQAFQAITPRTAPVELVVRQGWVTRVRRRIGVIAGLAVAAAGVAVPVLLPQAATQPVLSARAHHAVTVQPRGPRSPAGLIASGTVDGRRWQVIAQKPGTGDATRGAPCFVVVSVQNCGPVTGPSHTDPVEFMGTANGSTDVGYGPVSAAVRYVTVRLGNGTVLTLHPVSALGTRYVAFAVPLHMAVSRVTAYSARGELASAIPFNDPAGSASIVQWLRPGQTGLPRVTRLIGSGTAGGHPWSVTAYLGPWGGCLVTRGGGNNGSSCSPASSKLAGTSVRGWAIGLPTVVFGSASADVEHLVITLAGGSTIRMPAILAGKQKFFAFALSHGQHAVRWRAYDAARHETSSGRMNIP